MNVNYQTQDTFRKLVLYKRVDTVLLQTKLFSFVCTPENYRIDVCACAPNIGLV